MTQPVSHQTLDKYLRESSTYPHLGPFRVWEEQRAEIELATHEAARRALSEIAEEEGTPFSIHAPSPWHAVLLLQYVQERILYRPGVDLQSSEPAPSPLLFRGLANPAYKLCTSLERCADADLGGKRADAFARLMQQLGSHSVQLELPTETFRAVSQHYQFPTNLMDWTPDPVVAVFFANQTNDATKGLVYFNSIGELLDENLRVLLPPPLFERIRLQRGVFLEMKAPLDTARLHRIVFEKSPEFVVYRDGQVADLLKEPVWIARARMFINSIVDKQSAVPDDLWRAWIESDLLFHASAHAPRFIADRELPQWLDFFEEIRYWLACTMTDTQEAFRLDIVDAIKRDNPDLVNLHDAIMRALGKPY